jgi:crotonobetainyl-CoA:carnitine CoA-transferase CaiB-like acyl-CoA transferase
VTVAGPLEGIRVLDLTRVVAGPLATRVLADQGAEVIKVEPPEGDMSRSFPPIPDDGINPYFAQQNAGKRFCSIDLSVDGAPELIISLLERCDVVVENFRPGVMAKFGLGPDAMCQRFPRLVYCSITGFGQDGPWADRRAYAPIGHLESGMLEYDERKNNRQAKQPALVLGDAATAMMAANSINALLVKAARTGQGGAIDVCMVESMVYIQEWSSTELAGGWDSTNAGSCQESPVLRLPDGRVWGIAGNIVAWFDGLPEVMGQPELAHDSRFADPIIREQNRAELEAVITDWAATFDSFDEFRRTLEGGTPFTTAELRSIDELAGTDWAKHRQLFATTDSGIPIPARPATGAGIGTTGRVARRGADNAAVMADVLGMNDAAVRALVDAGVLVADRR